jgi:hypothetical protein
MKEGRANCDTLYWLPGEREVSDMKDEGVF